MNYLLEDIFRRPDTWRGMNNSSQLLPNANIEPNNGGLHSPDSIKTGFEQLDMQLYNKGWPLRGCIEVISDQYGLDGIGLFIPTMQKLSGQKRWQVFIAPPYTPYAPSLASEGIDLQELMLVHPKSRRELLWSIEQALRSSTCSLVFAWLGTTDYRYAELRKIQLAANNKNTLTVLFRSLRASNQHSPVSLRLHLSNYRQVKILKQYGGSQGTTIQLPDNDILGINNSGWSFIKATELNDTNSNIRINT